MSDEFFYFDLIIDSIVMMSLKIDNHCKKNPL